MRKIGLLDDEVRVRTIKEVSNLIGNRFKVVLQCTCVSKRELDFLDSEITHSISARPFEDDFIFGLITS